MHGPNIIASMTVVAGAVVLSNMPELLYMALSWFSIVLGALIVVSMVVRSEVVRHYRE